MFIINLINNHMFNKINYIKVQHCLENQGYFVSKNFLSKSDCKKFLEKIPINRASKKDPGNFHQGGFLVYNLQNKDEQFLNLIFNKKINKICENFFRGGTHKKDKDIYQFDLLHSRILKGKAKAQNLHLDSRVCGIYPPTHIQFFIYLNNVGVDDGPTQIVPKSHKLLRYPNFKDFKKTKKIIGKEGTLIILNSSLWHGSSHKTSMIPRSILTLSYCRWHLRQQYAVPYSIPEKFKKKLNTKQKKLLGYFNYPPKNEHYRLRMKGPLTNLIVK